MEEKIDVRLVEIIYFDVVDCQLLFLVTQLLPLALRLGDVLLGKLRDAVVFVPEQLELLVDSFLFLFPGIGQSHPFVIFDDAYVQGCIVGVGDDFDDSPGGKSVHEAESLPGGPVENAAPVAVTEQAFTSFARAVLVAAVVV